MVKADDYEFVDGEQEGPAVKLYTLDEVEQLARQWLEVPGDDDLPERLSLSNFLLWARRREREVGDGR